MFSVLAESEKPAAGDKTSASAIIAPKKFFFFMVKKVLSIFVTIGFYHIHTFLSMHFYKKSFQKTTFLVVDKKVGKY